jgi:hypothetical protein
MFALRILQHMAQQFTQHRSTLGLTEIPTLRQAIRLLGFLQLAQHRDLGEQQQIALG